MYALALFGLITIAGVGWDYSRMMTMDTELQNAADQAALAAATQLDGRANAMPRARAAANDFLANSASAWVNETKLANDGEGRPITGLTFQFYESYNHVTDVPGPELTDDADSRRARYVRVIVDGRESFFALTAIGGVLSSGLIRADAVATLEAAACNVPPLMFCQPPGNPAYPTEDDIGKALDLREHPQGSEDFTPGNFDLLQIDYENVASNNQNRTLGLNSDLLGCTGEAIETRPGSRTPETNAINTRFGVYANPLSCQSNGDFCPAQVVRSDLVRVVRLNGGQANGATCQNQTGGSLELIENLPSGVDIPSQSLPLDSCQTNGLGTCLSFGDGDWDIDTYFDNVHGISDASTVTGLDANADGTITRHEVYEWERADSSRTQTVELARTVTTSPNRTTLYCSVPTPVEGTPVAPSPTQKDRRIVTTAVVDCTDQNGRFEISTIKFVDLFLLRPPVGPAGSVELKAEILGPARTADGGSGFQRFGRRKPVLVR